ncbi:hypothetical protein [Magnetovibrio blakemorei]|uniref:Uncharacterized protein n=1 Tax=Magnetovibrio blakemorei TaxID=28181 RepID=A0A1E5Q439_9PROT|nr:hypothetical protein [Magnetovibrio blakemorei]OEJ64648.1 hypothetical protein BEN30_00725 [Magnetovibrio blakemorei]
MTGFSSSGGGSIKLINRQVVAGVSSVDFTDGIIDTAYKNFIFEGHDIVTSSDNVSLLFKLSSDGGATFLSSHFYKTRSDREDGAGGADGGAASAGQILMNIVGEGLGTTAGNSGEFTLELKNPSNPVYFKSCHWSGTHWRAAHMVRNQGSGGVGTGAEINAVSFLLTAGLVSGEFSIYGVL